MKFIRMTCMALLLCSAFVSVKGQEKAALLLLNRNVLERVKHDIARHSSDVMPAFETLKHEADSLLDVKPFTVMDKKITPPSGSKHDYISRAPYWWRNPDTANGLPYIRRDGEKNPELTSYTDRKAMESMSNAVTRLALAYYFTKNEGYATKAATLLRTWFINPETCMNPNLNYGQEIPGVCSGRGIGIIETRCLAQMLDYVILLQSSNSWTENDNKVFQQWVKDYLKWLKESDYGKDEASQKNNHGTWYDFQVAMFSLFTGDSRTASQQIKDVTRSRLDVQLSADGSQPLELARTRPWFYSTMNLQGLVNLAILGERVGVNLWQYVSPNGASLRKAVEWFFPYLSGQQPFPKKEITGLREQSCMAYVLMMSSRKNTNVYRQQLSNLSSFCKDPTFQLQTSLLSLTTPIIEGPILSDGDFYAALDLTIPALKDVKQAVDKGNYVQARHAFASYLRTRSNVKWYYDPTQKALDPNFDTSEADKVAAHYLSTCGTPYQFGDTIDWSLNPTPIQYCEWTWQLGRHRQWQSLVEAYRATGNEKYAKAWIDELRSWIIQSPLVDWKGSVDFSHWRTIETGIRTLYAWPDAFFAFLHSESFDDESMLWMVKSLYEHAVHLTRFPSQNNWFAMEMNGLFHICMLMPEFKDAGKWANYAASKMYKDQQIQFYPDGAQVELTPHYHGVSVTNYYEIASIAQINGYKLPSDFLQGLEAPIAYYMNIYMPDGCMPSVNDSGWGDTRIYHTHDFARMSEIYYAHDSGNDDIRTYLGNAYKIMPHRTDFQYVATLGKDGKAPAFTSTWMPWAGWYVMRSGWDTKALYAFYEVGPYSAAHSHEDKLSFLLHAYGKRLLTEGGTYSYDTSKWRRHTLSGAAHNVSRVDGKDQHRISRSETKYSRRPLENRWKTTPDFDFAEGFYTEGFGADNDTTVTQYRALVFVKDKYWLLFDIFRPTDQKEHEYTTWFHFNQTEFQKLPALRAVGTASIDEPNLYIYQLRPDTAQLQVNTGKDEPDMMGWVTTGHRAVATPTFIRQQKGVCVEPYLLLPLDTGKSQPVKGIRTKDNQITITYTDGKSDIISYKQEGGVLSKLTITTEGKKMVILP